MNNDLKLDDTTREKFKQILKPLLLENVPREYFYLWNLMADFHVKQTDVRLQMTQLQAQIEALERKLSRTKLSFSSGLKPTN